MVTFVVARHNTCAAALIGAVAAGEDEFIYKGLLANSEEK